MISMSELIISALLLAFFLVLGVVRFSPELRANYLYWRGYGRKARKLFETLLDESPEKANLYRKLAAIYYQEQRRDHRAYRIYEMVLKLKLPFEWRHEIRLELAHHYINQGRRDPEAIRLIEKALNHQLKALRRDEASRFKAGIDAKQHKDVILLMMALAEAYLDKGLFSDAARMCQQLLNFNVANKQIYTILSKAFIGLKKLDRTALEVYQKAVEYDQGNAEIYHVLARAFLKERREDPAALQVYEKSLQHDSPNFAELAAQLAAIYYRNQRYERCMQLNQKLLEKHGFQPKPLALFLKSCWNTGQHHNAIVVLKRLIDQSEPSAYLLKSLCLAYLEKKFHAEIQGEPARFSYVDRQFVADYLNSHSSVENLQDLSFFLEVKRFYFDRDYWSVYEPNLQTPTEQFAYETVQNAAELESVTGMMGAPARTFTIGRDVLSKLQSFGALTGKTSEFHSRLTYEDFQAKGAAIFESHEETTDFRIPDDAEIVMTIAIANFEALRALPEEQAHQIRSQVFSFLTELLEHHRMRYTWATSNGFLVFTNAILQAVAMAVEILNKVNRQNFVNEDGFRIRLNIGIHHARASLNQDTTDTLKDVCVGVKLATVTDRELAEQDRAIYGKLFQNGDRVLLSSKAYREVKSSNRFKVNSLGQFKFKYLKGELSVHEVVWRNPIDDLRFGFVNRLGRFELLAEVNSRSALKVFKAKDSTLQRFVMLKVVQSEAFNALPANSPQKMEFYRIAKAQGQLHHANIATIYEVNDDRGLTYIAREFVEGRPIVEMFRRGEPFNADRLIKVIYQICKGLQHAHRFGCLHLNLKPNNLFLAPNDEVKIMDFLIPPRLFSDGRPHAGDAVYRAPEQLHGHTGDARSDIFTLGVILYQTVTLRHPFVDPNSHDVLDRIRHAAPTSPTELNPRLPKFCDAFILKCLVKDPDKRFQSFEQMVTLLKKTFENRLFSNFNYQIAQSRDAI